MGLVPAVVLQSLSPRSTPPALAASDTAALGNRLGCDWWTLPVGLCAVSIESQ